MSANRIHFRESQNLTHDELSDEQAYRIGMRRRHNIAHHSWGIVQGLVLKPSRIGVSLSPGFAVDGYGRELVVPRPLEFRQRVLEEVLNDNEEGYVDVWLTYHIVASNDPHTHCHEDAWVRLDCAGLGNIQPERVDPVRPWEVPPSDLSFGPDQPPPDGPEREWPVYLGRIAVGLGDPATPPNSSNTIEYSELVYCTLVGASVQTPAGYRWLQIGDDEAADKRCFAITLPDEEGQNQDRLVLGPDGSASLWGRVRLSTGSPGDVVGDGDFALLGMAQACGANPGIELQALGEPPMAARPWQLYRTEVEVKQGEQKLNVDQLRFETFDPGKEGDAARASLVLGHVAEDSFEPLLTMRSDGTVIVDCNLHIEGQEIEGPIAADLDDERFRDELTGHWAEGLIAAGAELGAIYYPEFDLQIAVESADANQVTYTLAITHLGGGGDYGLPIVSIASEITNDYGNLIQTDSPDFSVNPDSESNPNPLKAGERMIARSVVDLPAGTEGNMNLTVRVYALGATNNVLEQIASTSFEVPQGEGV